MLGPALKKPSIDGKSVASAEDCCCWFGEGPALAHASAQRSILGVAQMFASVASNIIVQTNLDLTTQLQHSSS